MKTRTLIAFAVFCLASALGRTAERPPLLSPGTPAPDFTAYRADGSAVKLSEFRGKVVLIDFWSTWCPPCKKAMPQVEKIHRALQNQGLVVLGVCVWDKKEAFNEWQTKPQVPTSYLKVFDPAGRDPQNIAKSLYSVSGIPTFYLVGADGNVLFADVGFSPQTEKNLEQALTKAGFKL